MFKILELRVMDRVIWFVGTEDLVRTYSLHLLKAWENRPRLLIRSIHKHK